MNLWGLISDTCLRSVTPSPTTLVSYKNKCVYICSCTSAEWHPYSLSLCRACSTPGLCCILHFTCNFPLLAVGYISSHQYVWLQSSLHSPKVKPPPSPHKNVFLDNVFLVNDITLQQLSKNGFDGDSSVESSRGWHPEEDSNSSTSGNDAGRSAASWSFTQDMPNIQLERKRRLQQMCQNSSYHSHGNSHLYLDHKRKILYCFPPKVSFR